MVCIGRLPSPQDLAPLPDLQLETAILANHLEVGAVADDQRCAVGAGGQRNQQIEVQIAQLGRLEALVCSDRGKNLTRFYPVLLRWSEYRSARLELLHKLSPGSEHSPSTQLRQNNRRVPDPPRMRRDPHGMASRALIVDQDRCIEEDDFVHRLLIVAGKLQLVFVLSYQLFEAPTAYNFLEGHVNCFCCQTANQDHYVRVCSWKPPKPAGDILKAVHRMQIHSPNQVR